MTTEQLQEQKERLQASLEAWLQRLEEARREIAMHQGQLILLEDWLKKLSS